MRKFFVTILFLSLPLIFLHAQDESFSGQYSNNGAPKFYLDILDFYSGKDDITRVDVYVQIPYTSISFIKTGKGFSGDYGISVSVYDKDKQKLIAEKSWKGSLFAKDFDESVSKNNYSLNLRSFNLKPGKYYIRTAIENKEARNEYTKEEMFDVRNLSGNIAVSDIMLLNKRVEDEGKNKIIPNISGNVAAQKYGLPLFYEIYSKKPIKLKIDYTVSEKKHDVIYSDTVTKMIDSGRTQILNTIRDSSFNLGLYKVNIALKDSQNNTLASISKAFFSRWSGVPTTITDLNTAIDELIYIASTSQINHIKEAKTQKEKLKRFLDFWKTQYPAASTDDNPVFNEYYGRVAYANAHFSHYIEGWKTDRGMVFILLGPPDNIDRHPFDIDSKPYQVWQYYNLNVSLIFVDETGFGDYRLMTPLTGDLSRFRR